MEEIKDLSVDEITYERFMNLAKAYGGNDEAFSVIMKAHEVVMNTQGINIVNKDMVEETEKWFNDFVSHYENHKDAFKALALMYNVGNAIIISYLFPIPHKKESKFIRLKVSDITEFINSVKKGNQKNYLKRYHMKISLAV